MRSIRPVVVAIGLSFVGLMDWASAQDLQFNLTREDAYATRRMQVFKKSGDKLNGVVGIESFDARTNSFTMREVTGESVNIAIADLEKIEFQQALLEPHPMAQQAICDVTAQLGTTRSYKIAPGAIRIQSWDLILPASVLPSTISPITSPLNAPVAHHGGRLITRKILEAKKLTWDSSSNSFLLEAQEIVYSCEESGGAAPSGIRK